MLLDVPLIPDHKYIRLLNRFIDHIHSVHFSLYQAEFNDARCKLRLVDIETIIHYLESLDGARRYVLMNSILHDPSGYLDRRTLNIIAEKLSRLTGMGVIDGIVYADTYFLQALSDIAPELAHELEGVPSVNCMLDSFDKITAILDLHAGLNFKLPGKIILDRSLNRRPDRLSRIVSRCRTTYPEIKLGLLANEGCLDHCPFKSSHDALIACANMNMDVDTYRINQHLGCMRQFQDSPQVVFKSPFIRPEDMKHYRGKVDFVKICGRTLGYDFLEKTVSAYIEGRYEGNLLDLMDSLDWMADSFHISNAELPEDYYTTVTSCHRVCADCNYCTKLFNQCAFRLKFQLRDFRS